MKQCPKCGANANRERLWGGCRATVYDCQSEYRLCDKKFGQSKQCLQRQLENLQRWNSETIADLADIIRAIESPAVGNEMIDALCSNAWPMLRAMQRANRDGELARKDGGANDHV